MGATIERRDDMKFNDALGLVMESGDKISSIGHCFHLFHYGGDLYCHCPDGVSRPIDIEKDIPPSWQELDWAVTDGTIGFDAAMTAGVEFGGAVSRKSWAPERILQGRTMLSVFYQPTPDDRGAKDWFVAPRHGIRPDELCLRDGCDGMIIILGDGDCACHLYPPCGRCKETSEVECDTCSWTNAHKKGATNADY